MAERPTLWPLLVYGVLVAIAASRQAPTDAARPAGHAGERYFEYRLISPLFDHQGLIIRAVPGDAATTTAVRDRYGRQTAKGILS